MPVFTVNGEAKVIRFTSANIRMAQTHSLIAEVDRVAAESDSHEYRRVMLSELLTRANNGESEAKAYAGM